MNKKLRPPGMWPGKAYEPRKACEPPRQPIANPSATERLREAQRRAQLARDAEVEWRLQRIERALGLTDGRRAYLDLLRGTR